MSGIMMYYHFSDTYFRSRLDKGCLFIFMEIYFYNAAYISLYNM